MPGVVAVPGAIYAHMMPRTEEVVCPPCERFKKDYAAGHFAAYNIVIVEGGAGLYPMFKWEGGSLSGYNGVEWLKERLPKPTQAVEPVVVVPPPSNKPVLPEPSQPIADSAPVAPPVEQPALPSEPPPAPAARTESKPEIPAAGVWGAIAGEAIEVGKGYLKWGVPGAVVYGVWGLFQARARRKRSQSQPASAGEARAGPYGPAINAVKYPAIPQSKWYRVRDDKAVRSANEAFDRAIFDNRDNPDAVQAVIQAQNIFAQALSAPDPR